MNADDTIKVLRAVATYLEGKKTYLVAATAAIYLFGASMGWWPEEKRILEIFAVLGLASLRASVAKTTKP